MARSLSKPRKQRTQQHILADLSVNYVERLILLEKPVALRVQHDYGYDLILFTHDEQGFVEPGFVHLQLKASEILTVGSSSHDYVYDLSVADYNLWTIEPMPVFLILYEASRNRAYCLDVQHYFAQTKSRPPRPGAKTVRVYVPNRPALSRRTIAHMRIRKLEALNLQE